MGFNNGFGIQYLQGYAAIRSVTQFTYPISCKVVRCHCVCCNVLGMMVRRETITTEYITLTATVVSGSGQETAVPIIIICEF